MYTSWSVCAPVSYTHLDVYKRQFLLGTDEQGRDILSAIIYGSHAHQANHDGAGAAVDDGA